MTDYLKFYGLAEDPFAGSPDARFFFPSKSHSEALASLLYGINRKKGFILVMGEEGIGKTTVIHQALNQLDKRVTALLIPQGHLPFHDVLKEMLLQLRLPLGLETKGSMIHELYHHLIRCLERDETVTVIIDEAQNIGLDVIEEVRLLANLETSTSKLLQIVLVGEPALGKKLRADIIRQVKQRIVVSCRMDPMTEEESRQYIDHRLRIAGCQGSEVFADRALSRICGRAKGNPRALNTLCHNALSVGFGRSERRVSPSTVGMVESEQAFVSSERAQRIASKAKRRRYPRIAHVIPALVVCATALFFGSDYWLPLFHGQEPTQSTMHRATEDKAVVPIPEVPRQDAAERIPDTPDTGRTDTPPETSRIAVSPPDAVTDLTADAAIKEVIEVKQGVTLSSIAVRFYGLADEIFLDRILQLNPEIKSPNLILINQRIRIPEMTESSLLVPTPDRHYKVHQRTFRSLRNAETYKRELASLGKEIEIVPWKASPEETWYRVMAGTFADKAEALKFVGRMKQRGFLLLPRKQEKP